jgi:TPR repeat protein
VNSTLFLSVALSVSLLSVNLLAAAPDSPPPELPETLVEARQAAKEGDFKKAASFLRREAETGNADAAFGLAEFYLVGTGVEASVQNALEWYAKAEEAGSARAIFRQGEIYLRGLPGVERDEDRGRFLLRNAAEAGVPEAWSLLGELAEAEAHAADAEPERAQLFSQARDHYRKGAEAGSIQGQRAFALLLDRGLGGPQDQLAATDWLKKAARGGLAAAMNDLGLRYQGGTGVEADPVTALGWFLAAAERGSLPGMTNLGLCYANGVGVPVNFDRAGSWYAMASERGYAPAQLLLGQVFEKGQGIEQNLVYAFVNYENAARQGLEPAIKARDALKERLTADQLSAAAKILEDGS